MCEKNVYLHKCWIFVNIYIYFFLISFLGGGVSRGLRVVLVNGWLKKTFEKKLHGKGRTYTCIQHTTYKHTYWLPDWMGFRPIQWTWHIMTYNKKNSFMTPFLEMSLWHGLQIRDWWYMQCLCLFKRWYVPGITITTAVPYKGIF